MCKNGLTGLHRNVTGNNLNQKFAEVKAQWGLISAAQGEASQTDATLNPIFARVAVWYSRE